jgi:hypothetical protein
VGECRPRGFLFAAPCLDPELRKDNDNENDSGVTSRVEKGILFSAPCLDMTRDGEYKILQQEFKKSFCKVLPHPKHPDAWTCQLRF